ncbi:MAG: AAA family ATPase, partial [Mycoplasma sp.]
EYGDIIFKLFDNTEENNGKNTNISIFSEIELPNKEFNVFDHVIHLFKRFINGIKLMNDESFNNMKNIRNIDGLLNNYILIDFIQTVKLFYKKENLEEAIMESSKILSLADPNISSIIIRDSNNFEISGIDGVRYHDGSISSHLNLSSGTIRFISFLTAIMSFIKEGQATILIDELDSFLHPDLCEFFKNLVKFTNKNIQLIFTSHNYYVSTSNLSSKQIFFIESDCDNINKKIIKTSSVLNHNYSTINSLITKRIGSHPSSIEAESIISEILDILNEGND